MSRQVPSSRFAVLWKSRSSVTGCRCGSVPTPWQTSVSRCAVISLISLCLIEGKPPLLQLRAWSTVNLLQQAQWEGRCFGCCWKLCGAKDVLLGMCCCIVRPSRKSSFRSPFLHVLSRRWRHLVWCLFEHVSVRA